MEDRRAPVLVVSITIFVVATLFVALRFLSRLAVVKRVGLHDYLMLLAWLIDFGFSFSLFYATSKGLGLHEVDIRPEAHPALHRAEYAFTVLYNPALMAVKTSILVFYLTLTSGEKVFRWANYATLFVVDAAGLGLTLVNIFQCRPVRAGFAYPVPPDARCTDILTLYLSSAPVNIVTDLAILFLPMPILTRMRLPRKQKIILVVTFSFGFFATVIDVIRIAYLQSASTSRLLAFRASKSPAVTSVEYEDFSWYASLSFMWSAIEVNVGVICACVPSLKPLVARVFPRMIRDTDDPTTHESPAGPPVPSGEMSARRLPEFGLTTPSLDQPGSPSGTTGIAGSHSERGSSGNGTGNSSGQQGLLDLLAAPDTAARDVESTMCTSDSTPRNATFFDFVNMRAPKSMLKMNNRESIPPIAMTTILFFLWGFAYGLLDILNTQFQAIVKLDSWDSLGLHGAYYGGYVVGPPSIGLPVLKKWGFKSTFITGLCIYACGTLIFWPSAVLASFSAFIVSNFIVGFGLSVLETAANPFISLCGPQENAEVRLNVSQGVQAIGSVVSPLLAKKVLFKNVHDAPSLVDVQWTYLGIALFDVLLAVVFYYLPIPEASDEDLKELADRRRDVNSATVAGIPVVWLTLGLGVFSQFCYVGGQEGLSTHFEALVSAVKPNDKIGPFEYLTVGHAVFAVGRFLAAFAQWFLKPRWILLVAYAGMIVFSVLCMNTTGSAGVAMGLMVYLFESGAFSIIFAISLRGTAQHTKTASALMAAAISGGAIFPFPQQSAAIARGTSYSFCVVVAVFSAGAIFPLYLNLVPAARRQVDPVPNEYLRHRPRRRRYKQPVVHREKENPASGGVLSRRRSVLPSDPLPTVQLPEEAYPVGRDCGTLHDTARSL
ncbi:hypothetical protein VTN02DRAFT_6125 [Thermoascus thermophilus]